MKLVNRANLKDPQAKDGLPGVIYGLALFQVEPKVYRWRDLKGQVFPGLEADYLDAATAISSFRVLVEGEPKYVGWDLTILPVAPPPEERAAKRILDDLAHRALHEMDQPRPEGFAFYPTLDEMAEIIRNETAIDKLVEYAQDLIVYRLRVMRQPKPPGMDLVEGGLLYNAIEALERALATDFSNHKKGLTGDINKVQVYGNLPPGVKQ